MEKVTSVKIDNDKWEILKGRGYRLQDIIDNAFNNLLNINYKDDTELIKEIDKLKDENNQYELEKENLKKTLEDSITKLEDSYKNEISILEGKINENNYKIKELKQAIKKENAKKEQDNKNNECTEDYTNLIEQFLQVDGNLNLIETKITSFMDKWNINKDIKLICEMLHKESENKLLNKQGDLLYNISDFIES